MRAAQSRGPRLACLLVAALLPVGVLVIPADGTAAAGAVAPPAGLVRLAGAPLLPVGTRAVGALPPATVLHLDVTLRPPDPAALDAFVAALGDRGSPEFHDWLTPAGFGARFGPSMATVRAVRAALASLGLRPGPATVDRLAIPVDGTAARIGAAFHTSFERYRLASGRVVFAEVAAPAVPAAIAGAVQGVLGLEDVNGPRPLLARAGPAPRRAPATTVATAAPAAPGAAAGPQPCSAATDATAFGGFTANQLAARYGMSPLYGLGDLGAGVRVAIVEFEPDNVSDIAAYQACYGTHTSVTYTEVDGGASGAQSGEAALDIEAVIGLAPGASIDVFQAPNGTDENTYDEYQHIVDDKAVEVISTSWGECELDSDASLLQSESTLFAQAATENQVVLAAAGDYGSTDCYDDGSTHGSQLAVDDPGSQQYVVSVGGTTIAGASETVWNASGSAGGGGVSATWCMPRYQYRPTIAGLVNGHSRADSGCGAGNPSYFREVPDVTADADPASGDAVYFDGSWTIIAGTSAAAPLWAALSALVDASPFCSFYGAGDPGGMPSVLYGLAALGSFHRVLRDITAGDNDDLTSGYSGGLYPATAGYDMASGLGSPIATHETASGSGDFYEPGLAALSCYDQRSTNSTHAATLTRISPAGGPSDEAVRVTLVGTNFLPVPGAEEIEVGTRWSTAVACTSTTTCTATIPAATGTGAVPVRVSVEGLSTTGAVTYTYGKPADGYWLATSDGTVAGAGVAPALGGFSTSSTEPVVGLAATPDGQGWFAVTANGTVHTAGDAVFAGDLPDPPGGGEPVRVSDIVAIAPTTDGRGYWLIGADGGMFAFGDARFHGSLPGDGLHVDDVVGMVAAVSGAGYLLVSADGGVFAFGAVRFYGSLPSIGVHADDIRAILPAPAGTGYVLVGADGGLFSFGHGAPYEGSLPGEGIRVSDVVGIALTPDAAGYWMAGADGTVYPFGDAARLGTPAGISDHLPVAAIAGI